MSGREKILLLFVVGVAPLLLVLSTVQLSFRRAETRAFCSSCHAMTPWVSDLENRASDALAARHFRNRWIPHDQCYTCHVDCDFMGPVRAKIDGMRHIVSYYTGIGRTGPIKLYKPFPNENCLQCHSLAAGFNGEAVHQEVMAKIRAGQVSCIKCHNEIHKPQA